MKYAYVSLVLRRVSAPEPAAIQRLDSLLSLVARDHEIVIATPYPAFPSEGGAGSRGVFGTLTIVYTHARASRDSAAIAGLARSVGDFVVRVVRSTQQPPRVTPAIYSGTLPITETNSLK